MNEAAINITSAAMRPMEPAPKTATTRRGKTGSEQSEYGCAGEGDSNDEPKEMKHDQPLNSLAASTSRASCVL